MKFLALTFCSVLAFSSLAFAEGQADTDCVSMAESTERNDVSNTKKPLENVEPKGDVSSQTVGF